jgi:asparagine synthase (glutamine-hydrolysing)
MNTSETASQRESNSLSPSFSVETGTCGDWTLAFSTGPFKIPKRRPDSRWSLEGNDEGWQLWLSTPSKDWRGFPFIRIETHLWKAWLFGELYGTFDPAHTLYSLLHRNTSAASLSGHFHILAHDKSANEWHIWTNRYATLHVYRGLSVQHPAISSFLQAVNAAVDHTELDWLGLTGFFRLGFFADDRTQFLDIKILRPASHYRFDHRGKLIKEKRYWDWSYVPQEDRSYDDTVDEFAEIFRAVMIELTGGGRIGIPISGGLDSRSTVAAIDPYDLKNNRLWFYSYGYGENSIETSIAKKIAEVRELPIHTFLIQPYLFQSLELIVNCLEGFQDVTQSRQAAIRNDLHDETDWLIAAHLGDLFLDDMGLFDSQPVSMATSGLLEYVLAKFKKPGDWLIKELCQPQLGSLDAESVVRDLIQDRLATFDSIAEPDFRLKAYKTDQWSARWTTSSIRMFQAASFPRLPFYDTRLADFFMTVPSRFVAGRRLQIDYLKRYAPDMASVNWQVTGTALFKHGKHDPWNIPRRALKKGIRWLTGQEVIERNWEVQFLNEAGRQGLNQWLLQSGLQLHEFIPQTKVSDLIRTFYSGSPTPQSGYTVAMLLTFSAWLELHGNQYRQ